jgi:hypothetical protein
MSEKNKIVTDEKIEEILSRGYSSCKDCNPDRDASFVVNSSILEFERILHDDFGFGENYTDEILKYLSNLYEGIYSLVKNNRRSIIEYHKIIASIVYKKGEGLSIIANLYPTEKTINKNISKYYDSLKINDKKFFSADAIDSLYYAVISQHIENKRPNDLAHLSATVSTYFNESPINSIASYYAASFNGIQDVYANAGYIGDICGANGVKPSMGSDDYAADLDAVNLYSRYKDNPDYSIYEIFSEYYNGIQNGNVNRAREFLSNISLEKILRYRDIYSNFLLTSNRYNLNVDSPDYINRMNYYDNFVAHLINGNQSFVPHQYYKYNEY